MKKIYKYSLPGSPGDTVAVETVPGANIVHFALQNGQFTFWAEHERARETERYERRIFCVVGTGMDIEDSAVHRGTVLDGRFVWHLYESWH